MFKPTKLIQIPAVIFRFLQTVKLMWYNVCMLMMHTYTEYHQIVIIIRIFICMKIQERGKATGTTIVQSFSKWVILMEKNNNNNKTNHNNNNKLNLKPQLIISDDYYNSMLKTF